MAGGRPHTSGAVAVGGTSRAGMRSQIVSRPIVRMGPGWAAALDPRRQPQLPGANVATVGLALSSLVDDFSDGTVDPGVWPNSFGTYSETGGRARVQCDTGYNAFSSALTYRLAESQVSLRAFPPVAGGAATEAWTQILIKQQTSGTDLGFEISPLSGNLTMFSRTGFFDAGAVAITYDPVAHAWLRVRETGGNTYWETSPEGLSWTTRRTLASPTWVNDPNLEFQLIAHRDSGTTDYAEFDNVNIVHVRDDFDSYSTASTWSEGSIHGPWQVEFLGVSGQVVPVDVAGEGRVLQLEAVDPSSTSSTLVVSTPRTVGDVHWRSRLRTVAQLHTSPASWEVAWFVWNYDEPSPSTRRFYYVALKTGGFELGKVDQSIGLAGGQRFLWTDSTAFTVGTWYNLEVRQDGARIRVWVDGTLRADFTDGPGSSGTPSWGTAGETVMTAGSVAMYHEDARVQFGNVFWSDELTGDATLAATATETADGATGAGSVTGDATAAYAATLSAAGAVAAVSSGSLSAVGSLTAAGINAAAGAAAVMSTATITTAGVHGAAGFGSLAGSATPTASGTNAATAAAAEAATAALSAAMTAAYTGAATTAVAAGLTADGNAAHVGNASAAGTASLSTSGQTAAAGAASAAATATITAAGARGTAGAATTAGSTTLSAAGLVSSAGDAAASGTAGVSAGGTVAAAGHGAATVTAGITAIAAVTSIADAATSAAATLNASANVNHPVTASADVTASMTTAGAVQASSSGLVAATATPAAAAAVQVAAGATEAASATATAVGSVGRTIAAAAATVGNLSASGATSAAADGAFAAAVGLTAAAAVAHGGDASLAASAGIIASSTPLVAGTASLAATVTAHATGATQVAAGGATTASATVTGDGSASHPGVATATLAAALSADGAIAAAISASLAVNVAATAQAMVTVHAAGVVEASAQANAAGARGASAGGTLPASTMLAAAGSRGALGTANLPSQVALAAAAQRDAAASSQLAGVAALSASGTLTVTREDVDVTVGAPYVAWPVGGLRGAPYSSELTAQDWPTGDLYSSSYKPGQPVTEWEVAVL